MLGQLGDVEGAVRQFERVVTAPGLGYTVRGMLPDRRLDNVRDHPAFQSTVERLITEGR